MGIFNKIKKGVKHATNQVYKEQKKILKRPVENAADTIQDEVKEKYNRSCPYIC